jgi:hypothetical protein
LFGKLLHEASVRHRAISRHFDNSVTVFHLYLGGTLIGYGCLIGDGRAGLDGQFGGLVVTGPSPFQRIDLRTRCISLRDGSVVIANKHKVPDMKGRGRYGCRDRQHGHCDAGVLPGSGTQFGPDHCG